MERVDNTDELLFKLNVLEHFYKNKSSNLTIQQTQDALNKSLQAIDLEQDSISDYDLFLSNIVSHSHQKPQSIHIDNALIEFLVGEISQIIIKSNIDEIENINFSAICLNRLRKIGEKIHAICPQNLSNIFRQKLLEIKKQKIPNFAKGTGQTNYQPNLVEGMLTLEQIIPDIFATYDEYVNQYGYRKDGLKKVVETVCKEKGIPLQKDYIKRVQGMMNIIRKEQIEPSVRGIKGLGTINLQPLPLEHITLEIKTQYESLIQNLEPEDEAFFLATKNVFPKYQITGKNNNGCRGLLMSKIAKDLGINGNVKKRIELGMIHGIDSILKGLGGNAVKEINKSKKDKPKKTTSIRKAPLAGEYFLTQEIVKELGKLLADEKINRKYIFSMIVNNVFGKYDVSVSDAWEQTKKIFFGKILTKQKLWEEISEKTEGLTDANLIETAITTVFDDYALPPSWQEELRQEYVQIAA